MAEKPPTIFVIDDDASVRTSLTRLLGVCGLCVETFPSGEAYLDRKPYDGVGCIVLDVAMGSLSGTDLQAQLAQRGCDIPIIFLTGHGSIPMGVGAIKEGAVDFLTKPVDDEVLLRAIHQALARHERIVRQRTEIRVARARLDTLTPREREVLRYVLAGALNKQIAARLGIALKTVKVHRGQMMEKLGIASVADLVGFCAAAGLQPIRVTDA